MKKIIALFAFMLTLGLTSLTFAQDAGPSPDAAAPVATAPELPSPDDTAGLVKALIVAFNNSQWIAVAAIGIILFVGLVRKYGAKVWPKLSESKYAFGMSLVSGALLGAASGLNEAGWNPTLIGKAAVGGLLLAVLASGLFSGVKSSVKKAE